MIKRLNYDANTMEDAKQYLATRYKQVQHLGVKSDLRMEEILNKAVRTEFQWQGQNYAVYYILDDYRGERLFPALLKSEHLPVLTIKACGISDYLDKLKPECGYDVLSSELLESTAYQEIEQFYGDNRANRSGVFLMNHIDEGLTIMETLRASTFSMEAYCIHPLFQNDKDLKKNLRTVWKYDPVVVALTMEYRNKANSYLCRQNTDHFTMEDMKLVVGDILPEVRDMLIADKLQNQKDFIKYHQGKHERSDQLTKYFENWVEYLNPPKEVFDIVKTL